MNAKIMPGGKGRIPYLIRMAFRSAECGDREEVVRFWDLLMDEAGFVPSYKMKSQLLWSARIKEKANQEFSTRFNRENPELGDGPCTTNPRSNLLSGN